MKAILFLLYIWKIPGSLFSIYLAFSMGIFNVARYKRDGLVSGLLSCGVADSD